MTEFDDYMGELLGPVFKSRPKRSHRCDRRGTVNGRTMHYGREIATCSRCGKAYVRALHSNRWRGPLSVDELNKLVEK